MNRHRPWHDDPDDDESVPIVVTKADAIDLVNATRDVPNDPAAQTLTANLNTTPE